MKKKVERKQKNTEENQYFFSFSHRTGNVNKGLTGLLT